MDHSALRLTLIACFTLITACGSGGGGDSTPNNISADEVRVNTADPRIAHPLDVTVALTADRSASNVTVSLFAIEDIDDPNTEARQIPLGTDFIETVPGGASEHELKLTIPASVETSGRYYLAAVIDPAEVINELDEEDNTASIQVTLGPATDPNVILSEVALDRSALIINTDEYADQVDGSADNVHNADAGGTITIGSDGLEIGETVEIEAFASLQITRTDTGSTHELPLYLWNSEEQRYINAYGIDPETGVTLGEAEWLPMGTFTPRLAVLTGDESELDDVNRNSEHMDFYFPGKLGYELEQALRYPPVPCTSDCPLSSPAPTIPPPDLTATAINQLKSFLNGLPFSGVRGDESTSLAALDFAVCVDIRPANSEPDGDESDNRVCPALEIFLPPLPPGTPTYNTGDYVPVHNIPSDPLVTGDGFKTNNNNRHFGFDLDFGAGASADYRGYIEEIYAAIPVKVFGLGFDFMSVSAKAQLVPDYLNKPVSELSGFSYEVRFLNTVVDSIPPITGSVTITAIEFSKEVKSEGAFFVGPVPMVAGGSIGGAFGLDYNFGYADDGPALYGDSDTVMSLGSSVGPFANLEALAFVGLGNLAFSVGVEGVITLLEERIVYFVGTEIEVLDAGFTSGDVEFIITQGEKLSNVFTGPQGKVNLFAKYTVPAASTCKWKWMTYPCVKIKQIKAIKNIYSSPALFRREDVLFENTRAELDVVIVEGGMPAYFVPDS